MSYVPPVTGTFTLGTSSDYDSVYAGGAAMSARMTVTQGNMRSIAIGDSHEQADTYMYGYSFECEILYDSTDNSGFMGTSGADGDLYGCFTDENSNMLWLGKVIRDTAAHNAQQGQHSRQTVTFTNKGAPTYTACEG